MTHPNRITFFLEISNGIWTILAIALTIVCVAYLQHEIRARDAFRRWRWTQGMRVAIALATLAIGDAICRSMIYIWRHFYNGGPFTDPQFSVLAFGAIVSTVGFACAIREISEPLFGRAPWVITAVVAATFIAWELFYTGLM